MTEIKSTRRYYLLKRFFARQIEDDSESIWKGLQEALAGTALPVSFPQLTALAAAGYSTREDLDGADADELVEQVGLNRREAQAVLAALQAL